MVGNLTVHSVHLWSQSRTNNMCFFYFFDMFPEIANIYIVTVGFVVEGQGCKFEGLVLEIV